MGIKVGVGEATSRGSHGMYARFRVFESVLVWVINNGININNIKLILLARLEILTIENIGPILYGIVYIEHRKI